MMESSRTTWTVVLFVSCCLVLNNDPVSARDSSVRFIVLGDWGGLPLFPYRTPIETAVAKRLAETVDKYQVEFILALGDNFYFDGVKNISDPRFQETYNAVFSQDVEQNLPWYFVAGNHDHNGNVSAQIHYSNLEKRWNFPFYYYNLTFSLPGSLGTLDIVMIDTVVLCGNSDADRLYKQPEKPESLRESEDQWTWIETQLKNSKARYLIVAGHYPVYSIAEHGPTKCLVDRLMPMLHKYNVTAYLSGHDHNLQHLKTTYNDHTVNYFVSGAANFVDPQTLHKKNVPPGSSKFFWGNIFSLGGLAYVDARLKNMTLTFIQSSGKFLYNATMTPRF